MTGPALADPRLTDVADHAVLVEFADVLCDAAHAAVLQLDRALGIASVPGLREVVPAFVSLLVVFDPMLTDHRAIAAAIRQAMALPATALAKGQLRVVQVCYDTAFAPDMDAVCRQTGLSPDGVIAAHLAGDYRVFMYGFAPGYAYLGGVPAGLHLPRKAAPVRDMAAGSVMIAGPQCLVTTLQMPTGWWVIGRSPTRILDTGSARPFLFDVGDTVQFRRIDRHGFDIAQREGTDG